MLVLSSAAHALLGWPSLRGELVAAHTPDELIRGLSLGWHFGGAAMLALGITVLVIFGGRLRGATTALWPAAVVAILYVAFGAYALVASQFELFFLLVFVVPGLLLGMASWTRSGRSTP